MAVKFKDLDSAKKKKFFIALTAYLVIGIVVLTVFASVLYRDKVHARESWSSYLSDPADQKTLADSLSQDAVEVKVGTYVENLREINLKSSYYRVEFLVWFDWEGDPELDMAENFRIYKGSINKKTVVKDWHEGGKNYQLVSIDATVSKNYKTKRFPLESHQMRFYVESTYPIQEVVFVGDTEGSGMNQNIEVSGYEFMRSDTGVVSYKYESTHGDPELDDYEMSSEFVTAFEINRADMGLYYKCFIALIGTITWAMIALFVCTYHRVDPLGMVPAALFGTVTNIMVGAALVPDALEMGLLEFANLWGVITILATTIAIISINKERKNSQDQKFTQYFGRALFYIILVFAVIGQIILPVSAYIF